MNFIKRVYNNVRQWLLQLVGRSVGGSDGNGNTVHTKSLGREYERETGATESPVSDEFSKELSELGKLNRAYGEKIHALKQQQSKLEQEYNTAYEVYQLAQRQHKQGLLGDDDVDSRSEDLHIKTVAVKELQDEILQAEEYLKYEMITVIQDLQAREQDYITEHMQTIEQLGNQATLFKQDYLNTLLKIRNTRNDADIAGKSMQKYAESVGLPYVDTLLPSMDILTNQIQLNGFEISSNDIQNYINNRTPQRF